MRKRDLKQADSDCTLDYFMNEVIIAGAPERVTCQQANRDVFVTHGWERA
jgi:hypothetical protein